MIRRLLLLSVILTGLVGCDRVVELANQGKFNGRAIGAACRHSGRALEDCFQRNARVSKADIYAGWKDMNEYMAKNKLDVVAPPPDPVKPHGPVNSVEIGGGGEEAAHEEESANKDEAAKPADGHAATPESKPESKPATPTEH